MRMDLYATQGLANELGMAASHVRALVAREDARIEPPIRPIGGGSPVWTAGQVATMRRRFEEAPVQRRVRQS